MSPAALGFPGSEVTGRTPRSDTTGTLWPSEFRVKYVSGVFCLCIFFYPSFRRGKQKAGKEGRRSGGILSERWCKGQVSLADRLKYHSLPGARHPLWCSEGVCDKSGVMWRGGGGGAAAFKKPPGNPIDQVPLTESLTVGKSPCICGGRNGGGPELIPSWWDFNPTCRTAPSTVTFKGVIRWWWVRARGL